MFSITEFSLRVESVLNRGLPGVSAQLKMAPSIRPHESIEQVRRYDPKLSAVMILFFPSNEGIKYLYMKRNDYKGVHSGQIGFPGGKVEPSDKDLEHTALRETEEEVGIAADKVKVLGELTELYIPPSNFLVHPFLGTIDHEPTFIPDEVEVSELIEWRALDILNDDLISEKEVLVSGKWPIQAPFFDLNGETLWGATAMITSELKEILNDVFVDYQRSPTQEQL